MVYQAGTHQCKQYTLHGEPLADTAKPTPTNLHLLNRNVLDQTRHDGAGLGIASVNLPTQTQGRGCLAPRQGINDRQATNAMSRTQS